MKTTTAPRALWVLSGAALLAAVVVFARLSVFMWDASRPQYSFFPGSAWETSHSCVSAYFVAAQAAGDGKSVYDDALYSLPSDPNGLRKPRLMGPFRVDVYEYPPPFLLLPQALRLAAPGFEAFRLVWFALNALVVAAALFVVARFLPEPFGTRALLLSPLVLAALPMLSALQKGNVQLVVVAMSMLAMVLFERGRPAAGGALLAFATASKLYPGLLVVYLLARREWRALAWTAAFGVAFTAITVIDLGWVQFAGFLGHLPGLVGGEAFPAFRNPAARAINFSVPGLVFKLGVIGVGNWGFGASKAVGWIYTVAAVWATVWAARRPLGAAEKPLVWLAILVLATLRSPFLPQAYGAFPPLWLLVLLAATYAPTARAIAVTVLGWAALNVFIPMDWASPRTLAWAMFIPQVSTVLVAVLALRREVAAEAAESPVLAPVAIAV